MDINKMTKERYDLQMAAKCNTPRCTAKRGIVTRCAATRCIALDMDRTTRRGVDDIVRFIYENRHRLDSMDMIVRDEAQQRKIWKRVAEASREVYITSSIRNLVEIADKNAGKKAGLAFFTELLGLKREETAAFGDADNDIDMIRYAGCGIAMGNASESCKQAADFVTCHHDEDGVAEGIRNIMKLIS